MNGKATTGPNACRSPWLSSKSIFCRTSGAKPPLQKAGNPNGTNMTSLMISRSDLDAAKERLRIPELWRILNLPGEPVTRDGIKFCSPLRPDAHPSCSFYDGCRRMKDWSTGKDYDAIDFLGEALTLQNGESIRRFLDIANGDKVTAAHAPVLRVQKKAEVRRPNLSGLRKA